MTAHRYTVRPALTPRFISAALLGVLLPVVSGGAAAQQASPAEKTPAQAKLACDSVLQQRNLKGDGCPGLAQYIVDSLAKQLYRVAPRDLQNVVVGAATGGSLAQSEAVPTVQPQGIGGASVAAVGADSGTRAIVAMVVNPAIFFTSSQDADELAKWSRFLDLTLLFPADNLDRDQDGKVDYVGGRLRLNLLGIGAGEKIVKKKNQARREIVGADAKREVEALLRSGPNVSSCFDALLAGQRDRASLEGKACPGQFALAFDQEKYEELHQKIADARAAADATYAGIDVALDVGDPTLGAVTNARATSLNVGGAAGFQVFPAGTTGPSIGFKAKASYRYTHLSDVEETSCAFDGSAGFEGRSPLVEGQAITASAGFEFRYGGDSSLEDQLQTNFTVFRAALTVPLAGATGLALAVQAPIDGPMTPAVSVNFNWGLLFPKVASSPR